MCKNCFQKLKKIPISSLEKIRNLKNELKNSNLSTTEKSKIFSSNIGKTLDDSPLPQIIYKNGTSENSNHNQSFTQTSKNT